MGFLATLHFLDNQRSVKQLTHLFQFATLKSAIATSIWLPGGVHGTGRPVLHGINKASNGYCNCAYFECGDMSDKFESLDANEKAALESTLYRCRALVGRIGEELRKKKPEHFVDESSLADLHASLEHAAWVLEQKTAKG